MTSLRAAAHTDIGRVRQRNEDRLVFDPEAKIFGVADGVGGLPGGAEASQKASDEVIAALHAVPAATKPDYVALVQMVNRSVHQLGALISPSTGIGSTLTFGHIFENTLNIAHVGDSRCYSLRGEKLEQLTEDHSVENEARMRRARGETVYYHEANSNALTRCIGQPSPPMVDVIARPVEADDRYLFCTDGITRLVRDSELADLLDREATPEEILKEIISLAVRRGGHDNATGVLVFVDEVT